MRGRLAHDTGGRLGLVTDHAGQRACCLDPLDGEKAVDVHHPVHKVEVAFDGRDQVELRQPGNKAGQALCALRPQVCGLVRRVASLARRIAVVPGHAGHEHSFLVIGMKLAPAYYGVPGLVSDRHNRPDGLEDAGQGRGTRMGPGGRRFFRPALAFRPAPRPRCWSVPTVGQAIPVLLERDVLAPRCDELAQQLLELGLRRRSCPAGPGPAWPAAPGPSPRQRAAADG